MARYKLNTKVRTIRETALDRVQTDFSACSNMELLGMIIGGKGSIQLADSIIEHFNNDPHLIVQASILELRAIPGVTSSMAAGLKASFALASRLVKPIKQINSQSASEVFNICSDMRAFEVEYLRVLSLNTKNCLIGRADIYKGCVNSTTIRVGEVFRPALQCNASNIIIAHNHPSGDPTPSREDIEVTRTIKEAGKLLNINLLDHVVLGHGGYKSIREMGLL